MDAFNMVKSNLCLCYSFTSLFCLTEHPLCVMSLPCCSFENLWLSTVCGVCVHPWRLLRFLVEWSVSSRLWEFLSHVFVTVPSFLPQLPFVSSPSVTPMCMSLGLRLCWFLFILFSFPHTGQSDLSSGSLMALLPVQIC